MSTSSEVTRRASTLAAVMSPEDIEAMRGLLPTEEERGGAVYPGRAMRRDLIDSGLAIDCGDYVAISGLGFLVLAERDRLDAGKLPVSPIASEEPRCISPMIVESCQYTDHKLAGWNRSQLETVSAHVAMNSGRQLSGVRLPSASEPPMTPRPWSRAKFEENLHAHGWLVASGHGPTLEPYHGGGVQCGTWGSVKVCTA